MTAVAEIAEPGPVPQRERIQALDVARGIAVLGVLLMNIWSFAGPQAFFDYPLAIADRAGAPVATWAVIHTLFEGSQRTLLSILFGAGALLAIGRFERPGQPGSARGFYYRRTLGLILLGLMNAYLFLWPADILFAYGLAGLCLYPLRRFSVRTLLLIALAAMAVPAVMRVMETSRLVGLESAYVGAGAAQERGQPLSAAQKQAVADWQAALKKARPSATDEDIAAGIRTMQTGTLPEIAVRQAGVSIILETIVTARWWFLDALAMMIIGMALCRTGILTRPAPKSRYAAMAVAGFAIGLPLAIWQTQSLLGSGFDPVQVESVKISYDVRRLAMGLGYLSLILLFCQSAGARAIKARLAAAGRMALTNYLGQSIVGAFIFYGFGLGLYGRATGYQLYLVVALVWALELAWSGWWLGHFQIGPFEWLWRSFIYRRPQSWRGPARTAVT
jgi:uncharacterized protein